MNREEFLRRLEQCLKGLPSKDVEDALRYYEDYFEDANGLSDEEIIASLGKPEDVAKQIRMNSEVSYEYTEEGIKDSDSDKNDLTVKQKNQSTEKGKRSTSEIVLLVIIIICALPIIAPIAGGIIAGIVGIIAGILGIAFALLVGGIVALFTGLGTIFVVFPNGVFLLGLGLVAVTLGILFCRLLWVIAVRFIPWLIRGIVKICKMPFEKNNKEKGVQ